MSENGILKNLKETYLLAAADLALYPEGSREYRRAEQTAMNTSRTVLEIFGAVAVEELREAGLKEWSRVAERISRGRAVTNFEKITKSPEALANFLGALSVLSGPWDEEFQARVCAFCTAEDCDSCRREERDNPLWWLTREAD